MTTARPRPVRFIAFFVFTLLFAAPAVFAQSTWSANPTTNNWTTASNWTNGVVPAGTSAVAVFGNSTRTSVLVDLRLLVGTLQFDASATAPYTLEFQFAGGNVNTSIRFGTIVNNSGWAPTLTFRDTYVNQLNGGALADANLVFTNTYFYFNGTGGTSTISMNGGALYYGRAGTVANGENARLILNGTVLQTNNPSDGANFSFGSIEGNGTIDLTQNSTLTVGANNRSSTFSGTIVGSVDSQPRSVTKVGTGTWTLTGNSTTDAAFSVTGGTLAADANSRLGTGGALTLDGGAFRYAAAFNDLRALVLGASGGTIDTQGHAVTHSTGISGSGALTKIGSGSLTLDTANTYSGGTTLSAGTLVAAHDSALGTGTLTLAGGTLAASGTRSLANAVTLSAASAIGGSSPLTFTGAWTLAGNHNLTVNNSATTTIAGAIGESGGPRAFLKDGSGTLELTGANTYTGGTLIAGGTVRINNTTGSAFGTGGVTIANGATLTGAGSFTGALQNNGTYSPGNSPDLQTLSSFNQGSTGTLVMEIAGLTRGTGYDALDVTGTLTFGGALQVSFIDGFTGSSLSSGATFNFFDWASASGTFNALNLPDLTAYGLAWDTSALYTSGELSVTTSAVPEPSTYGLIAGLATLGVVAWRRRREAAGGS